LKLTCRNSGESAGGGVADGVACSLGRVVGEFAARPLKGEGLAGNRWIAFSCSWSHESATSVPPIGPGHDRGSGNPVPETMV